MRKIRRSPAAATLIIFNNSSLYIQIKDTVFNGSSRKLFKPVWARWIMAFMICSTYSSSWLLPLFPHLCLFFMWCAFDCPSPLQLLLLPLRKCVRRRLATNAGRQAGSRQDVQGATTINALLMAITEHELWTRQGIRESEIGAFCTLFIRNYYKTIQIPTIMEFIDFKHV